MTNALTNCIFGFLLSTYAESTERHECGLVWSFTRFSRWEQFLLYYRYCDGGIQKVDEESLSGQCEFDVGITENWVEKYIKRKYIHRFRQIFIQNIVWERVWDILVPTLYIHTIQWRYRALKNCVIPAKIFAYSIVAKVGILTCTPVKLDRVKRKKDR